MRVKVIAYTRTQDGQSWERAVKLPFPPFLGLDLHLEVGGSIVGFRVVNVEYHEVLTFQKGDATVVFLRAIGKPDYLPEAEEFALGERWNKNNSVRWPAPDI